MYALPRLCAVDDGMRYCAFGTCHTTTLLTANFLAVSGVGLAANQIEYPPARVLACADASPTANYDYATERFAIIRSENGICVPAGANLPYCVFR